MKSIQRDTSHDRLPLRCDLIQMIRNGEIARLRRFVVEPYDDGRTWGIQTVAVATPNEPEGSFFPVAVVEIHEDDQAAMTYALRVFEALRVAGKATAEDVCRWRRGLFAVVPGGRLA